jgi:hypothetical protein
MDSVSWLLGTEKQRQRRSFKGIPTSSNQVVMFRRIYRISFLVCIVAIFLHDLVSVLPSEYQTSTRTSSWPFPCVGGEEVPEEQSSPIPPAQDLDIDPTPKVDPEKSVAEDAPQSSETDKDLPETHKAAPESFPESSDTVKAVTERSDADKAAPESIDPDKAVPDEWAWEPPIDLIKQLQYLTVTFSDKVDFAMRSIAHSEYFPRTRCFLLFIVVKNRKINQILEQQSYMQQGLPIYI